MIVILSQRLGRNASSEVFVNSVVHAQRIVMEGV